MMKRRICLILSSLALAACAGSSADVVKTYELIKPVGAPYTRILVLGAHPDATIRRQLENALVDSLREAQINAVASIGVMNPDETITHETVRAAAERVRADAVFISRPQDVHQSAIQARVQSSGDDRQLDASSLLDFFRYEYAEYEDPIPVATLSHVIVTTDLYRISDGTRIWSVESSALQKDNFPSLLESVAASTRGLLQRDELVR